MDRWFVHHSTGKKPSGAVGVSEMGNEARGLDFGWIIGCGRAKGQILQPKLND